MIVYADIMFIINFTINACLIYLSGRLFNCKPKLLRVAIGGITGAVYQIVCIALNLRSVLISVLVAVVQIHITYNKKRLMLTIIFMTISFLTAGILNVFNSALIVIFPISLGIACYIIKYIDKRLKIGKLERRIEIKAGDKRLSLDGYIDSGNELKIAVISRKTASKLFKDKEIEEFDKMRCVTVNGEGYISVFTPDLIEIDGKQSGIKVGIVNEDLHHDALLPAEYMVREEFYV